MPLVARSALLAALCVVTLVACVNVRFVREPTLPAPDWWVYSSAESGLLIALPNTWRVFDLDVDGARTAALAWAKGDERGAGELEPGVQLLMSANVRFFAVDTDPAMGGLQAAAAYVVRLAAPAEGVDAFASNVTQLPGRRLVERRHLEGAAGDLLLQRIEQQGEFVITQYQFLIVKGSTLHTLLIELPEQAMAAGGATMAERMGLSFTPVGSP